MTSPRTFPVLLALACWSNLVAAGAQAGGPAADTPVARGAYLVRSMACADCHTPHRPGPHGAEPDFALGLSGHPQGQVLQAPAASSGPWVWGGSGSNTAFWGPWGVSYAANLTPDATGLGAWTAEQFVQAMRSGRHAGAGRPIAPPMPWHSIGQLTEPDLRALFAYLRSQPPVRNAVPGYQPPVPSPAQPAAQDEGRESNALAVGLRVSSPAGRPAP